MREYGIIPGRHRAGTSLALFALLALLAASGAAQTAVVTRNVNLRAGHSSSAAVIRQLQPPDELTILDTAKVNGYYEVTVAGAGRGWVWARNVRLTAAAPPLPATGPAEVYRGCPLEGSAVQAHRKESNRKKNRITAPAAADIDSGVTIDSVLRDGVDTARFSDARAASIVAFVVDVKKGGEETVNCGDTAVQYRDTHIDVVQNPNDTSKIVRMVVEVTPRWRAHVRDAGQDWSTPALKQRLLGRWVRFTGWLFWDFEHADEAEHTAPGRIRNWRATAWELHPVTEIKVCATTPQAC